MNDLTKTPSPKLSVAYSANAEMTVELAKMLALVMPTSMTGEQQELWLRAAVDSLQDIRPAEVAAVSTEARRSVTRPSQIVPEVSRLVAEKRARTNRTVEPSSPMAAALTINSEAQLRRGKARNQVEVEEVWQWERSARADAGLAVPPIERPLSAYELENMPAHIRTMGLNSGFLKRDGDRIMEVNDPREIDRIREELNARRRP